HRIRLGRLLASANLVEDALAEIDAAAEEAAGSAERHRAEVAYVAIARQSLDTRPLGRERLATLAADVDPSVTDAASRTVLAELGYEQALTGTTEHRIVVDTLEAAFGGDSLGGVHDLVPSARYAGLLALTWCGEHRFVERAANLVLARSRRRGAEAGYVAVHQLLANVYWSRGQLGAAVEAADEVLGAADAGVRAIVPGASGLKAAALATMGRIDDASKALSLPGGEEQWVGAASFQGYLLWQSIVRAAAGDHDAAFHAAQRCGTLASVMGTTNPAALRWRTIAAEAAMALGRQEPAALLAEDAVRRARAFGAPGPLADALRVAARCGATDNALPLLREAERLLASRPERLEQARLAIDLGAALTAGGSWREAEVALRRASDLAVETGAALLGAEAVQMLVALEARKVAVVVPSPLVALPRRATQALEIHALGGFSIVDADGRDHTPSGVPGRAVRIVVAAGRDLHVEELADRLWDEALPPAQVLARLRNVVARTRTPAGPILARSGDRVGLDAGVVVDADRFAAAAERAIRQGEAGDAGALDFAVSAALLYGGDLLPTDPYADWAAPRRDQLRLRYLRTSDIAARLAGDANLVDLAIDLLESAIRHDPHDLERYEYCATLLQDAGRPSQARAMRNRAAVASRRLEA
ncbi:MAG: hypothetical protein QOF60_1401, partial [Actinomycetota bacterium]|nr:hypothetical protein [Actinomycetota bacterium]